MPRDKIIFKGGFLDNATPTTGHVLTWNGTEWVPQAAGGGGCTNTPMTLSALNALRSANSLYTDCHYIVTDIAAGNLGASGTLTVLFHAVSGNELSTHVLIGTAFDVEAWHGEYDFGADNFYMVADNIGNRVYNSNGINVETFRWGVSQINNNLIYGTFTSTSGTTGNITGCYVGQSSTLNVSGVTASIIGCHVDSSSTLSLHNLTNASTSISEVLVTGNSIVNIHTSSALLQVNRLRVSDSSTVGFVAAGTRLLEIANMIVEGNSDVTDACTAAITRMQDVRVSNSTLTFNSTTSVNRTFDNSVVEGGSSFTWVNTSGTAALVADRLHMSGGSSYAGNLGTCTITDLKVDTGGAIVHNTHATAFVANQSTISNDAQLDIRGTGSLTLNRSRIDSGVLLNMNATTSCVLTIADSEIASDSSIVLNAASGGTVNISGSIVTGTSTIIKSGANRTLSITASNLSGNSQISELSTSIGATNYIQCNMFAGRSSVQSTSVDNMNFSRVTLSNNAVGGGITITGDGSGSVSSTLISGVGLYDQSGSVANVQNCALNDGTLLMTTGNSTGCVVNTASVRSGGILAMSGVTNVITVSEVDLSSGGILNMSGACGNISNVCVYANGEVTANGSTISGLAKSMNSTLSTGAFTQTNIYHHFNANQTLTAANTGRGRDYFNNNLV
jgi:hypothetical protein